MSSYVYNISYIDAENDACPNWTSNKTPMCLFVELTRIQQKNMVSNLREAYNLYRELSELKDDLDFRAQNLFDSYHLLSGATELSMLVPSLEKQDRNRNKTDSKPKFRHTV